MRLEVAQHGAFEGFLALFQEDVPRMLRRDEHAEGDWRIPRRCSCGIRFDAIIRA